MCCRCCQRCLEDFYWNCIEERFCYDESIANYNPDEDEYISKNNIKITSNDNNNLPIINQPLKNDYSFSGKIHEEDYRREIQTSVPILAPEILAVFANSQIFNESKPNLSRVSTVKSLSPNVHATSINHMSRRKLENDQEKLIFHLEGPSDSDSNSDGNIKSSSSSDKKIKFTISDYSPIEIDYLHKSPSSQQFSTSTIEEESEEDEDKTPINEVILRPRLQLPDNPLFRKLENKQLRHVHSVPQFSVRSVASENDIFSISDSFHSISMTPEVPSISYSNLPKNYEDTPTIEKYKETVSLQSIQVSEAAKAERNTIDYSNPKYFRRTALLVQSVENLKQLSQREDQPKFLQHRPEKSKRLKTLRDSLPPLTIHIPKYKKEETKH